MRSWLVALRIARREAQRAKGRTALIVAMIGLPVLALTYAAATFDMQRLTPTEKVTRTIGQADAAVTWRSDQPEAETPADASQQGLIGGDDGTKLTTAGLLSLLPAGSNVTDFWTRPVSVRTAGGVGTIVAYGIDMANPITAGLTHLISGRAPSADNEIMVSPSMLARMGAKVGQTVSMADGTPYVVVGTGEVGGAIDNAIVFRPSQRPTDIDRDAIGHWWLVDEPDPASHDIIATLNQHGLFVQTRALMLKPPPGHFADFDRRIAGLTPFSLGTLVAGLGLLEVVLLAGPAFAMGARRRQRDLALVATNGGTPAMLRRIVLADGVVCGVVAAVVGVVAGITIAFTTRPLVEQAIFHGRMGGYRIYPLAVVAVVGIALLTGLLGAMVPAFTAARQEIVMALSGRRGATRSRLLWLLIGVALVAAGAAGASFGAFRHSANVVLAGLVTGEFGLVLCTPTLVGVIAHVSRFLPVAPRMALRDASRRRAAAAPAISAVMAAVAGSVALTVYLSASAGHDPKYVKAIPTGSVVVQALSAAADRAPVPAPIDRITTAIRALLPGAKVVPFKTPTCPAAPAGTDGSAASEPVVSTFCSVPAQTAPSKACPFYLQDSLSEADQLRARADPRCNPVDTISSGPDTQIVTDDPVVVSAVTGLAGDQLAVAVATLRRDGVLVSDPSQMENGSAIVSLPTAPDDANADKPAPQLTVPAYLVTTGVSMSYEPILSPGLVTAIHLHSIDAGVLAIPIAVPSQATEDGITAALSGVPGTVIYVERGNVDQHRSPVPLMLAIAAAVIALGAAGIATGLAAADSRHDLTTLAAVGATPRVRRVLSLAQSGVITGLGSVIGAVAGIGAAAAVITGINSQYDQIWPAPATYRIIVPWLNLGISLLAVPLTAMLFAGLLTRARLPSERRAD